MTWLRTISSLGGGAMSVRITIANKTRKLLESMLGEAKRKGNLQMVKRIMAILALAVGHTANAVSSVLQISEESIRLWVKAFMLAGTDGLRSLTSPGRPGKLTKRQKKELDDIIQKGPEDVGFTGACWRTPMIQDLILKRFGVLYNVNYLSQLLKNMGFSYQKAKFVADHKDPEKRKEWVYNTWSEIMRLAKIKNSLILFGDEASFPQWGTLTYTWAKRGQQPTVMTSGIRKGYKVLGLIDYFSGRFFFKGHTDKLNSNSYSEFLLEILAKTDQHIILIQDGARYHTSQAMREFFKQHCDRLSVYQLPTYSPDYNPIEKLWKKVKQDGTHLHYFPTFEALVAKVNEILPQFSNCSEEVLSLFGFYKELENQMDLMAA